MDEKAESLNRIIEEDYIERLKQLACYYRQFRGSQEARLNFEAIEWAVDKLIDH